MSERLSMFDRALKRSKQVHLPYYGGVLADEYPSSSKRFRNIFTLRVHRNTNIPDRVVPGTLVFVQSRTNPYTVVDEFSAEDGIDRIIKASVSSFDLLLPHDYVSFAMVTDYRTLQGPVYTLSVDILSVDAEPTDRDLFRLDVGPVRTDAEDIPRGGGIDRTYAWDGHVRFSENVSIVCIRDRDVCVGKCIFYADRTLMVRYADDDPLEDGTWWMTAGHFEDNQVRDMVIAQQTRDEQKHRVHVAGCTMPLENVYFDHIRRTFRFACAMWGQTTVIVSSNFYETDWNPGDKIYVELYDEIPKNGYSTWKIRHTKQLGEKGLSFPLGIYVQEATDMSYVKCIIHMVSTIEYPLEFRHLPEQQQPELP